METNYERNYELVSKAIRLLAEGLHPFVDCKCRAALGDDWLVTVGRSDRKVNPKDLQFLLNVLRDKWRTIFVELSYSDRCYVFELLGVRNRWAHNEPFSTDDTLRALDTARRLLKSVAASDQAVQVDELYLDLLRQKYAQIQREDPNAKRVSKRQKAIPPTGATLFEIYQRLRSGIELLDFVAIQLYERHGEHLLYKLDHSQISRDPNDIRKGKKPRSIGIPGVYIDRNLTIAAIQDRAYLWLSLLGYSDSTLQIHDD